MILVSDDRISSLCLPGKYVSFYFLRTYFVYVRQVTEYFHRLRPSWPTAHLFSTYSRAASLPAPLPEALSICLSDCLFSFGGEDLKKFDMIHQIVNVFLQGFTAALP